MLRSGIYIYNLREMEIKSLRGKRNMITNLEKIIMIVAAVLMAVLGTIYVMGREESKKQGKRKVLMFKAAATLVADVLAIMGALQIQTFAAWSIAIGIFLYACADILLELKFIWGMLCFGIGHLWVIAGIGAKGVSVIPAMFEFLVLCVVALMLFKPYLKKLKQLKVPGLIYTAILCLMSATTLGVAWESSVVWDWVRVFGSLCFVTSDAIIGWNFVNHSRTKRSGAILMILYYLAVYLIAVSSVFSLR